MGTGVVECPGERIYRWAPNVTMLLHYGTAYCRLNLWSWCALGLEAYRYVDADFKATASGS